MKSIGLMKAMLLCREYQKASPERRAEIHNQRLRELVSYSRQNSPYYAKAARRFDLRAVCAVGLCDTGTLTSEVRKATSIPVDIPLFTLQGGIDRSRLKGMDKLMISMLTKGLASQKRRSAQDERMLELLRRDESYVSPENLSEVLQRYREEQL